jgi:hypothetical protein
VFFLAAVRGPLVGPGQYTVKIMAGGSAVQKTFQVEEDPRIQLAPADREERLKTQLQITQLQKRTDTFDAASMVCAPKPWRCRTVGRSPDALKVPASVQ